MKSLRQQFEEDYRAVRVPAKNRTGFKIRYIYSSPWHFWDLPSARLKQRKLQLAGVSAGGLLLFVLTGIQISAVNCYRAVEIGGTLALAAHIPELFAMIRFLFAGERLNRMTYSGIDRILGCIPFIRSLCLLAAAGGSIAYLLRSVFEPQDVLVALGYLICAVMALYLSVNYRRIPQRTAKNHNQFDEG